MSAPDYHTMTRDALAAAYVTKIGYDPFEDDPTVTEKEIADTLKGWDEETERERIARIIRTPEFIAGMRQMAFYVAAGWTDYRKLLETPAAFQAQCEEIIDTFISENR